MQNDIEEQSTLEIDRKLDRILDAVERDKRKRWVEIVCAIVLSLATMASAWCAYQSTLWGGVQTFRLAAAGKAGRESAESNIAAMQRRAFDASMFINYIQAKSEQNERLEEFLYKRFRPEMKLAVDAWLKTDPENNSDAPPSPFHMTVYVQQDQEEAKRQDDLAAQTLAGAQEANQTSDAYVLLTVLFASVLFFGGMASTIDSRRVRIAVAIMALVLFSGTMITLLTVPVCRE